MEPECDILLSFEAAGYEGPHPGKEAVLAQNCSSVSGRLQGCGYLGPYLHRVSVGCRGARMACPSCCRPGARLCLMPLCLARGPCWRTGGCYGASSDAGLPDWDHAGL